MIAFADFVRGAPLFAPTGYAPTRSADAPRSPQWSPGAAAWSRLIDDLLALRCYEDDWDGQGAEAPDPAIVDGAITLAKVLRSSGWVPAARAIAGSSGTVSFEWHMPDEYIEVEVTGPSAAQVTVVRRGETVAEVFDVSGWM